MDSPNVELRDEGRVKSKVGGVLNFTRSFSKFVPEKWPVRVASWRSQEILFLDELLHNRQLENRSTTNSI